MAPTDSVDQLDLVYRTDVEQETDAQGHVFYVASHPELDGCMAQGDSPKEAIAALQEARELYLHALLKRGLDVPRPRTEDEDRAEAAAAASVS